MRVARDELRLKLRHQCREAVDGVGREFYEPAESSSLQRCGEDSAHDRIVSGVQAHVRGVRIRMLIWISRAIIAVHVEAFPLVWKWDSDDRIGKRVSTHRIHCTGRADRLIRTGLAIHLLSGGLVLSLLNRFWVGRGGDRLTDEISRHDGRSLDQLTLYVFVLHAESFNLSPVLPTHFLVPSSNLNHLSL